MASLFDLIIHSALKRLARRLKDELGKGPRALTAAETGAFPYPVIEVDGKRAVTAWQTMTEEPGVTPIIIGTAEEDLGALAWPFENDTGFPAPDVSSTLEEADEIVFETGIFELRTEELRQMIESARDRGDQQFVDLLEGAEDDDWREEIVNAPWPEQSGIFPQTGPISLDNWSTGRIEERLLIALIPTEDATEAPAFLSWGGWNSNPMPEWHVAAFRSWQERFGAEPVVMRRDVLEFKVARPPSTRETALALALEMYEYCPDIVDQGVGSVPALAATLLASDWWYFWWD